MGGGAREKGEGRRAKGGARARFGWVEEVGWRGPVVGKKRERKKGRDRGSVLPFQDIILHLSTLPSTFFFLASTHILSLSLL